MKTNAKRTATPILDEHLKTGVIRIERLSYVNADGTVAVGTVGFEAACERYLVDHPTPETW